MKIRVLLALIALAVTFAASTSSRAQHLGVLSMTSMGMDLYAGIDAYPDSSREPTYDGIYRSTDYGASWVGMGLKRQSVYALASVRGTLIASTGSICYSKDAGKTWISSSNIAANSFCVIDSTVYAGTFGAIYKSSDQGVSWQETGLTKIGVVSVANSDSEIFAGCDCRAFGQCGVYRSTDDGTTWTSIGLQDIGEISALCKIGSELVVGATPKVVPFANILISSDNGKTWDTTLAGDCMAFAQSGPYLFAGTYHRGVFVSKDSGRSWSYLALRDSNITALAVVGNYLSVGTGLAWTRTFSIFDLISSVSVAIKSASSPTLSIHPNPATSSTAISIRPEASGYADIAIVDILGQEVVRVYSGVLDASEHTFTLDTGKMPVSRGVYECVVRINGKVQAVPIVVE